MTEQEKKSLAEKNRKLNAFFAEMTATELSADPEKKRRKPVDPEILAWRKRCRQAKKYALEHDCTTGEAFRVLFPLTVEETRTRELEAEGMTRSDAQGVLEAETLRKARS